MPKGRKKILTEDEINDIIIALSNDKTLTKREIMFRYHIHPSTLYKYLPVYLKNRNTFIKKQAEKGM